MKRSGFKMKGYSYPGTPPKASPARKWWKPLAKFAGGVGRLIRTGHWKNHGAPRSQSGILGPTATNPAGYSEGHTSNTNVGGNLPPRPPK